MRLRDDVKQKRQTVKEDRLLRRLIEQSAEKYLQLRKKRFEERIPSLNEFLSTLYRDC